MLLRVDAREKMFEPLSVWHLILILAVPSLAHAGDKMSALKENLVRTSHVFTFFSLLVPQ